MFPPMGCDTNSTGWSILTQYLAQKKLLKLALTPFFLDLPRARLPHQLTTEMRQTFKGKVYISCQVTAPQSLSDGTRSGPTGGRRQKIAPCVSSFPN